MDDVEDLLDKVLAGGHVPLLHEFSKLVNL